MKQQTSGVTCSCTVAMPCWYKLTRGERVLKKLLASLSLISTIDFNYGAR